MESKPATIREIAKAAGVSPSTVFRVLNSGASVSPNTRAKVIAAQQILQNKKAITPAKESSRFSVGIIMPAHSAADLAGHPAVHHHHQLRRGSVQPFCIQYHHYL